MRYEPEQLDRLIASIQRQAAATERHAQAIEQLVRVLSAESKKSGLGDPAGTLYTRPPSGSELVDEKMMAAALDISDRTLGRHRRAGRLPGCWIRNGGRIFWRVAETQEAWERGIA